ncbi:hypothetical protein [Phocaeicola faecalis]|uniref:hypothetical protein n=1 Tax=Phocaeicola faecalis TaxID=2786956 RepID=UPI001F3155FC|nr:hypothetical protein [Phocaeicola faecalis]
MKCLCFRFATEEDYPQEVQSLSATQLFERVHKCVPGGGMLGRILFENVYSSLKISPTVG